MKEEFELDIEQVKKFLEEEHHEYLTTHKRLCFAKIKRIYRRVLMGYRFGAIKVSEEELIIEGNHRYIAYKLANIKLEIIEGSRNFSDTLKHFKDIEIDIVHDWDYNNPDDEKFCYDDFLKDYPRVDE